jgi:hypothetical protein
VLEPDVDELGTIDGVDPAGANAPERSLTSMYRANRSGFGGCGLF